MTWTYVGSAHSPLDAGSQHDMAVRTPDAAEFAALSALMAANDFVKATIVVRSATEVIALSVNGGQAWTGEDLQQGNGTCSRIYTCRWNGTWGATPAWRSTSQLGVAISIKIDVFRLNTPSDAIVTDIAQDGAPFPAPTGLFDVTVPGKTPISANTLTTLTVISQDENTWERQTSGFVDTGTPAQHRNTYGGDVSIAVAHVIKGAASAYADCVFRQKTLGPDQGRWISQTWKQVTAGVIINSISDGRIRNGETGVTFSMVGAGASRTGLANILVCLVDAVGDASAVSQPSSAWADIGPTVSTFDLSSFPWNTNLFVFVKDSAGNVNSAGFVIQREARFRIIEDFSDGGTYPSKTGQSIVVRADGVLSTDPLVYEDGNVVTDASSIYTGPYQTVGVGSTLNPNLPSPVYITFGKGNTNQDLSRFTTVEYYPTYE